MFAKLLFLFGLSLVGFASGQRDEVFPDILFKTQLSANATKCLDKIKQNRTGDFRICSNNVRQGVWNGPEQEFIRQQHQACRAISTGLDCVVRLGSKLCTQTDLLDLTIWSNSVKPYNDGSRPVQVRNYTIGGSYSTICNRVPLNSFSGIQFLAVNATYSAYLCWRKMVNEKLSEVNKCNNNVQRGVWSTDYKKIKDGRSVCKAISVGLNCIVNLANKTCKDNNNRTQLFNWAYGNKCTQVNVNNYTDRLKRKVLFSCDKLCQPKQKLDQKTADYVGNVTQLWVYHHLSDKVNKSRCINDTEKQSKYVKEYMDCIDLAKDDWIKRETNETLDHVKCCLKWSVVGCYLKFIKKACDVSVLNYLDKILRDIKMDDCPNVGYVNKCEKKLLNFLV